MTREVIRETCSDHRVVIEQIEFRDGELEELEVAIEHPHACQIDYGEEPRCVLAHEEINIGTLEALRLAHPGKAGVWTWDQPALDLAAFAITTGRVSFPITYTYSGGYDYWGEYDSELTWWPR